MAMTVRVSLLDLVGHKILQMHHINLKVTYGNMCNITSLNNQINSDVSIFLLSSTRVTDHENLQEVDTEKTLPDQTDGDANYKHPFSPCL